MLGTHFYAGGENECFELEEIGTSQLLSRRVTEICYSFMPFSRHILHFDAGVENECFVTFSRHVLDDSEWALGE